MLTMSRGRRNFILVLISFMVGIIYFVPYIRFFFYDQAMMSFNLTNFELGNLGALYGFLALFSYPLGGILADKFSTRVLLAISFIGTAALTFWQATLPGYATLMVTYGLLSFFTTATLWSPYIKMVRSLGTEDEQGRVFGVSEALRGVVSAVVGFGFLWVMGRYTDGVAGFQMVLTIAGIMYIGFAILALLFLPKIEQNMEEATDKSKDKSNFWKAIKLPATWLVAFFLLSCFCIINAGVNYMGTYTTQILGVSPEISSGLAIFRSYVILTVAGVLGGILADKSKARSLFIIYLLIGIIICAIAIPFSTGMVTLAIVFTMVLSFLYFTMKSVYWSVLGEGGIPLELTAVASGIISFIVFIPDAFMTSLMGAWLDADPVQGFNMIFTWMGIWGVIGIILALIIYKRSGKHRLNAKKAFVSLKDLQTVEKQ